MEVSEERISYLAKKVMHLDKRRWKHRDTHPKVFMECTGMIAGIMESCKILGIDLGIRRVGRYYRYKEELT